MINEKNISKKKISNGKGKPQKEIGFNQPVVNDGYEYRMSRECANAILKSRKGNDAKKHPQQYLCEYVTEQYGLLGTCVKVNYN